jgi:hypothetical protein
MGMVMAEKSLGNLKKSNYKLEVQPTNEAIDSTS